MNAVQLFKIIGIMAKYEAGTSKGEDPIEMRFVSLHSEISDEDCQKLEEYGCKHDDNGWFIRT